MKDSRQILQDRNSSCNFSRRLDRLEGVLAMVSHSEKYKKCNISLHTYPLVYVIYPPPKPTLEKSKNKKTFFNDNLILFFKVTTTWTLKKKIFPNSRVSEKVKKEEKYYNRGTRRGQFFPCFDASISNISALINSLVAL